jgi:hypothetical protein
VVHHPPLDDHVGVAHRRLDVASAERPFVALVRAELLVDHRSAVLERLLRIDDGGQRVVVHDHLLRRVDHAILVRAEHQRDGVAHVSNLLPGEGPMLGHLHLDARWRPDPRDRDLDAVEVVPGEHGHDARVLACLLRVDRADAGVRLGRPYDRRVQHSGQVDVVRVGRAPRDQARVLLAAKGPPDVGLGLCLRGLGPYLGGHADTPSRAAILSAADITALTMLW